MTTQRIADDVPESIKLNLLFRFVDGLQDYLLASLRLDSEDAAERLQGLLAEDPQIARERAQLKHKLARLTEIKKSWTILGHDESWTIWSSTCTIVFAFPALA